MKRFTVPYGYWEAIMWTGVYLGILPSIFLMFFSMSVEQDGFPLIGACGALLYIVGLIGYLIGGKMTGWEHLHGKGTLP